MIDLSASFPGGDDDEDDDDGEDDDYDYSVKYWELLVWAEKAESRDADQV